ncbi:hypothetical protein M5K25_025705 [Dendrobium thyrsiflorum]|uniref:Uncharacterized protein n=1 Tax=Dendrobium thyrsiflorum TaxID=117978 RepID=A0ABD0U4R4_DENTH
MKLCKNNKTFNYFIEHQKRSVSDHGLLSGSGYGLIPEFAEQRIKKGKIKEPERQIGRRLEIGQVLFKIAGWSAHECPRKTGESVLERKLEPLIGTHGGDHSRAGLDLIQWDCSWS